MKKLTSITKYIFIQIILLISILVLVYSLTINLVYQWGVEDTTHYYMSLEADNVWRSIEGTGKLPDEPNEFTRYYLTQAKLPEVINRIFPIESHQDGVLLSTEEAGITYSMLPYHLPNKHGLKDSDYFYVVHSYNGIEDEYEVLLELSDLQLLLLTFVSIIILLLVRNLAWSIILPIRKLGKWGRAIGEQSLQRETFDTNNLKFEELKSVADELQHSINKIEENQKREKSFLQTLSHELRTPLAVTKAAIELLQMNQNNLDEKTLLKLDKIKRANNNMLNTTQSLLSLWKQEKNLPLKQNINLYEFCCSIIDANQHLLQPKTVTVQNDIPKDLNMLVDEGLLKLLVSNLLRNAFQYGQIADIYLFADVSKLIIRNKCGEKQKQNVRDNKILLNAGCEQEFGYGVGLYLVDKICVEKGWQFSYMQEQDIFEVKIIF